ncbi:hypothetical protein MRB53_038030 [Persea americana]|nr:hypothetical protein MRB53_038030 [Persea americana]
MFAHCRSPIWREDDFSACFRRESVISPNEACGSLLTCVCSYLQTLFPLLCCAISILLLASYGAYALYNSKYGRAFRLLNTWHHVWDIRMPPPGYVPPTEQSATSADIDDEIERTAELNLHPTVSHAGSTTIVEPDKPKYELLVVAIELVAVVVEIAVNAAAAIWAAQSHKPTIDTVAGVVFWGYVLLLTGSRFVLTWSSKFSFTQLWYHTAFLYCFQWLMTLLILRTYIIYPRPAPLQGLLITDFVFVTVLSVIALSSRKGNKPVALEYEGDIPPAREPVASVFSLATFSWVDAIVWHGYKKTFELADVWNLARKDKAAVVLANYRQVKKTTKLTYHLLKHFKGMLILQAAWSMLSGFLTFIPTLLLKMILEYIEDPNATPRNSAWFFVILLFVSGCASAVSDGQGLWTGRKVTIRLRAIIIGELYTKALKRKAGTSDDKILGAKTEETTKKTFWQKLNIFKSDKKDKDAKDKSKSEEDSEKKDGEQVTSGTIINLMAVDSFKVSEVCAYLHFLWGSTPVQIIVAVALLYQILGFSSIAGVGLLALLLPLNMFIAKKFASMQHEILAGTDARIHSTNEILTNIRIIKYFAWEQRFLGVVEEKRAKELKSLNKRYIYWAAAATLWAGAPVMITFASFAIYTLVEKKPLVPSVAFTALSLFQILRIPFDQLADMVAHVQEAAVSVNRIEEYLNEEDTQKSVQLRHPTLTPRRRQSASRRATSPGGRKCFRSTRSRQLLPFGSWIWTCNLLSAS